LAYINNTRMVTTPRLGRGLSSSSGGFENRGFVPRSRLFLSSPTKSRRLRRDAPVKRPSETDSASLDSWDSAVGILKRGKQQGPSLVGGLRIALLIDAESKRMIFPKLVS
jgi:hypothetical protein